MKKKRLNESATLHYYYLQAYPYPVAGKYPKKSENELLTEEQERLEENSPNGAILWWYWNRAAYPYPSAGTYNKKQRRVVRTKLHKTVARGKVGDNEIEDLLS